MFSSGNPSITLNDILSKVGESDILSYYLGITNIPCVINSPIREDKSPSFGIYSPDGVKIYYIDFANRDYGSIYNLLKKLWGCSFKEVLIKIYKDMSLKDRSTKIHANTFSIYKKKSVRTSHSNIDLRCKVRKWLPYDLEYWKSFGISLNWLQYAEIYPISHKIIVKNNKKYIFSADKYAYVYVEHKDNKTTLKIYQPFNTTYKWCNNHNSSVLSLWTKIPKKGEHVCVCSSVKDALCLYANVGIPSIALQGEAYKMSNTAINELRKRFDKVYICLDNDEAGLKDAELLAKDTNFINKVLPYFKEGKDIADLYKAKGKTEFIKIMKNLFNL